MSDAWLEKEFVWADICTVWFYLKPEPPIELCPIDFNDSVFIPTWGVKTKREVTLILEEGSPCVLAILAYWWVSIINK
jgi:hypothetical protein